MNLNESYTTWAANQTPENYEIFGKDLLLYVKSRVRKYRKIPCDLRNEIPVNVIIRILEKLPDYDAARSPFSVWVNYKVDDLCMETLKEFFERKEYYIFDDKEAPDKYAGIEAKILVKKLMETLSEDEQRLVQFKLDGLEGEEIAVELGVSHEVIRKRWERLQEKMKKNVL